MKTIRVTLLATVAVVGCLAGCGTVTTVGDAVDREPGTSTVHDAWPGCVAAGAFAPDPTAPDRTAPDRTVPKAVPPSGPDGSESDAPRATTQPGNPGPDTAPPDASRADASRADVTAPDATRPDGALPDATRPDGALPDGARPDATRPDGARPDGALPDGAALGGGRPGGRGDDAMPPGVYPVGVGQDALRLPRLGEDFVARAAVVCGGGPEKRADGGTDAILTESRATDVAALVDTLRLPDQAGRQGGQVVCTMDLPLVPWLVLIGPDGRWTRPGIPVDGCGKPRIEVREAVGALALTRVETRVVGEVESAGAAATGCGQSWADMLWVETHTGNATPGRIAAPPFTGPDLRVCVFEVPDSQQGGDKPAGEFVHGGDQKSHDILEAIAAAPPARACDTPAGRFALIGTRDRTGGQIYVELDGCQRIMAAPVTGGPVVAQGDDALARLLDRDRD